MKQPEELKKLSPEEFTDETFGLLTIRDILSELEKPGRDPRPEFKTATFQEGIETLTDLKVGMLLEGVVTNVAAFGAFIDIGVHQDGLVHVSALANHFVKDPHQIVKPGQIVKVKVLAVDIARQRISLTMRLDDPVDLYDHGKTQPLSKSTSKLKPRLANSKSQKPANTQPVSALAIALSRIKTKPEN